MQKDKKLYIESLFDDVLSLMIKSKDPEITRLALYKINNDFQEHSEYYNILTYCINNIDWEILMCLISEHLYGHDNYSYKCNSIILLDPEVLNKINELQFIIDKNIPNTFMVYDKLSYYHKIIYGCDDFFEDFLNQNDEIEEIYENYLPIDIVLSFFNPNIKIKDLIIPLDVPTTTEDLSSMLKLLTIVQTIYPEANIEFKNHNYYLNVNNTIMKFHIYEND